MRSHSWLSFLQFASQINSHIVFFSLFLFGEAADSAAKRRLDAIGSFWGETLRSWLGSIIPPPVVSPVRLWAISFVEPSEMSLRHPDLLCSPHHSPPR